MFFILSLRSLAPSQGSGAHRQLQFTVTPARLSPHRLHSLFSVWLLSVSIFSDFWTASFAPLSLYQTGVYFFLSLFNLCLALISLKCGSFFRIFPEPLPLSSSWFPVETSCVSISSPSSTPIELNQSSPEQAQCSFSQPAAALLPGSLSRLCTSPRPFLSLGFSISAVYVDQNPPAAISVQEGLSRSSEESLLDFPVGSLPPQLPHIS